MISRQSDRGVKSLFQQFSVLFHWVGWGAGHRVGKESAKLKQQRQISWLLVPTMGQAAEPLDPTFHASDATSFPYLVNSQVQCPTNGPSCFKLMWSSFRSTHSNPLVNRRKWTNYLNCIATEHNQPKWLEKWPNSTFVNDFMMKRDQVWEAHEDKFNTKLIRPRPKYSITMCHQIGSSRGQKEQ